MKEKLVLVGNGMAGMRTIEELLKIAPDQYEITVIGEEPYGNYNRILLSPVLSGEKLIEEIMLNDKQWYEDNNIHLIAGKKVASINRKKCTVTTDDGMDVTYDRMLLATGSSPFVLPLPGNDLPGVITFRDIADVNKMIEAAQSCQHAVVIGGGLLGLEAANGLMKQGMSVTVVHLMDTLMERQLDYDSGKMLQKTLEDSGMQFMLKTSTDTILGDDRVHAVRFKDGSELAADIVVMAVGIKPNIELAKNAGIYCERGVVVTDTMQTYDPKIYSVGECVQHRKQTYGLVAPLFEQAKVCANHLAMLGYATYIGSMTSTKLKVTGIDLFSAGDFVGTEHSDVITMQDAAKGIYKKIVIEDNKIIGSVLYGDTIDSAWYFQLMREQTDISDLRDHILFGQSHMGDSGHGEQNKAALLPNEAEVCGCNGVCKGDIINAISSQKLFTLDDVRAHTKASSSCGSCTGLVEQILAFTLGGDYSATPKDKPVCSCTDYTHDEVRQVIKENEFDHMDQIFNFLEWKNPNGCQSCRPALNYYLISTRPKTAHDDYQSRFINERAHANIQKDGTFSVIPRMLGGMVKPDELRAIADVADKFNVPEVKVTGGQRIDLLGLKKHELPAVWKDLNAAGLVSGHAYGKAMRTVKTCVGSEWCRFGTQNSTKLGIMLEKMTWGSWTPHKFKLAVSGCPRNCAEATIKDIGVVCVDSGYELHIGGNGGVKVRVTDFLCKVDSEDAVLEYTAAFLQIYREEARYLERTAPWVERVGLSYIKSHVVENAETRKQLQQRFLESQAIFQIDPWDERASKQIDTHEFKPLKIVG